VHRDRLRRLRTAAIPVLLSLSVACASSGGAGGTPTPSGPSGALGVVTTETATAVVRGLCAMRSTYATDIEKANSVFYGQVHDELRVIAAVVQGTDNSVATKLLQARERLRKDLTSLQTPEGFVDDVDSLLSATRDALRVIGFPRLGCA
jgi:hypothetical protein